MDEAGDGMLEVVMGESTWLSSAERRVGSTVGDCARLGAANANGEPMW